ncbi:MAG: 3-deoxy-manno-octulosonate cytidylyltransferase (CMP-KDO synthetase), partial [Paraglaciecola sp.]
DEQLGNWLQKAEFYKHIGLYAFRKNTLEAIAKLPVGRLENWEKLEQLRWLENGCSIGVEITELETIGIDTPEDLALAIKNLS